MTFTKRAELDAIGFDVGNDPVKQGQIALRWRKLTYDEERLVATEYHRAMVDADTDMDAALEAVAQDLEQQGFTRPPSVDRAIIDATTAHVWTPEVRAAVAEDRRLKREQEAKEAADREAAEAAAADEERQRIEGAVAAAIARSKA